MPTDSQPYSFFLERFQLYSAAFYNFKLPDLHDRELLRRQVVKGVNFARVCLTELCTLNEVALPVQEIVLGKELPHQPKMFPNGYLF